MSFGNEEETTVTAAAPVEQAQTAEQHVDPKQKIIEQIQTVMPDMPMSMMGVIQQMSPGEAEQVLAALPALSSALMAARNGQDVAAPNIPGAQALLDEAKEHAQEKAAIQQTLGNLMFGGAAAVGMLSAEEALAGGGSLAAPEQTTVQPKEENKIIAWAKGLFGSKEEGENLSVIDRTLSQPDKVASAGEGWILASSMDSAQTLSASNDPGRGLQGVGAPGQTPGLGGPAIAQSQQQDAGGRMRTLNG